jgi:hypothetical protein
MSTEDILDTLEYLNLLQRSNHGVNIARVYEAQDSENDFLLKESKSLVNGSLDGDEYEIAQSAKSSDPTENISYSMNGSVSRFYQFWSFPIKNLFMLFS